MRQPGASIPLAYNPDLLHREDLIRGFVARQPLLERLLEDLRREGGQGAPQHHLVLGQRGTGKTTLLRRLAFAVEDDGALSAIWLPLIFPEEQYNVADLGVFWMNCVDALSDALDRGGNKTVADDLDAAVERIPRQPDKRQDAALALLTSTASRLNKRLVLLVDNLDLVLERLDEEQDWAFRRIIAQEHTLLLVGASSRALEAVYKYGRAFYDFFQIHELKGLSETETLAVLRRLAEQSGQAAVARLVDQHPERIRAMRVLTGGNPRTVVLLYKVLSQGPEGDLEQDLEQLLDLYTPLYKARFEDLGDQAQVIVDVLALHWDPATAAVVAARVDMGINAVSAQLKRLEELGVVEKTPWFGEKKAAFQIAERFFNIWYLMRASRRVRRKLIWLVKFLEVWFTEDELKRRAKRHLADGPGNNGEQFAERAFAYAQAVRYTPLCTALDHAALHALLDNEVIRRRIDLSDLPAELQDKKERMLLLQTLRQRVSEAKADWGGIDPGEFWRLLGGSPHYALNEKQRVVESLDGLPADGLRDLYDRLKRSYNRLAECYPKNIVAVDSLYEALLCGDMESVYDWPVTRALAERAGCRQLPGIALNTRISPTLAATPLQADELERAQAVLDQMVADDHCGALGWHVRGNLLTDHLERYEEAEVAYRCATELDPTSAWPWVGLGDLLSKHFKHYEEAGTAYRHAIELEPADALLWVGLGILLTGNLGRHEEAEAAYRRAIELDPVSALPWLGLGVVLKVHLKRYEEAEAAYRCAAALDPTNARPWFLLGNLLENYLERYEEAEAAYRHAIELEPGDALPWKGLGKFLTDHLQRYEEAEAAYRRAIALDPADARSWDRLGMLLTAHSKRYEEAEAAFRHAITLDPADALQWVSLGMLLTGFLKRHEEAETAYRHAIKLDPLIAFPWKLLGDLLQRYLERYEEAEAAYRRAIELDPHEQLYPCSIGLLLELKLERPAEAADAYLAAIRLDANCTDAIRNLRSLAGKLAVTSENAGMVETWMREASELVPDEAGFLRILAQILMQSGSWSEAETWLARWAELGEESSDAYPLLSAIIQTRHLRETLDIMEKAGLHERQRPLFEALKAVNAGTLEYLNRIAPEVRVPAVWILKEIAPELF